MPPIGSGAFGVVNKAVYNGSTVAVKTLFKRVEISDFEREFEILR